MQPGERGARCPRTKHTNARARNRETTKEKKVEKTEFPVDKKCPKIKELIEEFRDVFRDELEESDRLSGGMLDLKLKPGAETYMINRVQNVNFHEMDGCMRALQAHTDGGLLEEHDEKLHGAIKWLFYGQYIEKPGKEGEYRIVGDFKELNKRIEKLCYDINTRF